MTVLNPSTSLSGSVWQTAVHRLGRLAGSLVHFFRSRRDIKVLAGFDDHMLADIGLNRGDIRDAVAQPPWREPTSLLVKRVHERQLARNGSRFRLPKVQAPPSVPEWEEWPASPELDLNSRHLFPPRSRYY